jgi:hypothetical protein
MFGVAPDIKIISFGVKRLKNRRVTPNGEENTVKTKKETFCTNTFTWGEKEDLHVTCIQFSGFGSKSGCCT